MKDYFIQKKEQLQFFDHAPLAMASELLSTPPTISAIMKMRHSAEAVRSFLRALAGGGKCLG